MLPFPCGVIVAPKMPSPAAPPLCAPSSNIVTKANKGGAPLFTRQKARTVGLGVLSSTRAVIATVSVGWGMMGEWETDEITGAPFAFAIEFTLPGVP